MSKVQCISLFSGAGGLDVGAKQAGVHFQACVENDPDAAQTLRLNVGRSAGIVYERSIADVDFRPFRDGDDRIVIGGPPCQPFSKNGYWVKNENRLIERDPRNMLSEFLRTVSEVQPNGFLFENVDSLLHPTNKQSLHDFLAMAEGLGYRCTTYRANAADFGVPQKRKRVFVFGVRKNGTAVPPPVPTHAAQPDRSGIAAYLGVGEFISEFGDASYSEPSESAEHGTYYKELVAVPPGANYIALSRLEGYSGRTFRSGGRFWNFLHKLHPDLPSITIAAQPGPWVGPFHWTNRRLRVPEAAAIQTFPKGYKFAGSRRAIQKQIGNAVPCLLGKAMVGHLLEHL
ncbi:DNA cytosine methyltransferase [Sphingomonas sp.]|uniref:DNA cytosine methyltransferase n=1 Tax=Sphingomonas sp. TaxID=28214 RepID=UPI002EDB4585